MPNTVAALRAEIEAAHPGATVIHRGETGFVMLRPDGKQEHRYTTGPWHWRPSDTDNWAEIDTDLEARSDTTWKHGVRSARFDTVLSDNGRRRFYPRRWITSEYVEFGVLQYQRSGGSWASVSTGTMGRVANRLVGTDAASHRLTIGANGRGTRTHLVLKNSTIARPVRWAVTLVGLIWQNGTLVSASDGTQVGFIRPPTWTDAADSVTPRTVPWEYAGGYITLTPNFGGAVYPIVLDPDYSIAAGADDGYVYGDGTTQFDATSDVAGMGKGSYANHAFFRFDNISANQGDNCTAAILTVRADATRSGTTCNLRIYLCDADDPAAPTTAAQYQALAVTTAYTDWSSVGTWTAGAGAIQFPDFSTAVDEVLARAGWATGQAMIVLVKDNGSSTSAIRGAATYEHTVYTTEPFLSLTVEAGAAPSSVSSWGMQIR